MFAKFYQSELAYLRELGREFAAAHPNSAGLLSERSDDPDVERLLEGFAFLSAQIRERVDDAVPELVEGLAELLVPHALRPRPAMSIVEFDAPIQALRGVRRIPRGRALASKPVDGTACSFRTCYEVELLPLAIVAVEHDEAVARQPVIRLGLRTTEAGRPLIAREQGIRLFLAGELALAAMLRLWLLEHCVRVEVHAGHGPRAADAPALRVLGREQIRAVGFADDEAVLAWPAIADHATRPVHEYFALPSKFLFVDVCGLDGLELPSDELELAFVFERPPPLPSPLAEDSFRLHCTPVINLFEAASEPVRLDPLAPEQLLRAAGLDPRHVEIHEVEAVVGLRPGRGHRRRYTNFHRFEHLRGGLAQAGIGARDPRDAGYYVLRRSRSVIDEATDTYLRVARAPGDELADADETLCVELLCSNRNLAHELQVGDICKPVRGSSVPEFRNITAVSPPVRVPLGSELQWRLLAQLAVSRRQLTEVDNLALLLSLANLDASTGAPAGRANELRISAIRASASEPVTRIVDGAPVRGCATTLELDEARFASVGDAHLLGAVLDQLFASYAGINTFHQLRVRLHPSKVELPWPARTGQHRIL